MVNLKKHRNTIIFLFVGLIIMAVILYFIGIDTVVNALKNANPWYIIIAVILQCITYYLYTLRWYIINKSADMGDVTIKKLLPMVLLSLAVNNITPSGRGGGEPVRAYVLSKESDYTFDMTFATVLGDRALDTFPFIILAIITIIGMIFTFELSPVWIGVLVACVTAITILVVIIIYMSVNESFGTKLTNWIVKLVKRFYKKYQPKHEVQIRDYVSGFQRTMRVLITDRNVLLYALPLSFLVWFMEILRVYCVFLAFSANVPLVVVAEVFIIACLVGMVPLLPGGLGAVDGIMILFYSGAGITASISAAATVVERLISFWMTTILGLIALSVYGANVLDSLSLGKAKELSEGSSESENSEDISQSEDETVISSEENNIE